MHISEINIFPIKSLKGVALDSAVVEPRGLQYDRRWMLTDVSGKFFTQREFPKMATIKVEVTKRGLLVSADNTTGIMIPFEAATGRVQEVTIWQSVCPGEIYSDGVNQWFSQVLETDCQLVHMPDESRRSVNPRFDQGEDIVSFADGYPLMLLGEASLDDLNARMAENDKEADRSVRVPLPMNRFRPNLVVSGSDAFAEDDWDKVRIGEAVFRSTKPCERCVITTIDQSKGEFDGKEPLKILASYRMAKDIIPDRYDSLGVGANAVLFGQNLIAEIPGGAIKVGDKVEVIE